MIWGVPLFSETSIYSAILKVDILLRCLHGRQWNFHITVSDLLNRQYEFIMIDLECPRSLLFLVHAYLRTQVQLVCREASMSPMRRSLLGTGNQADTGSVLLWLGFPNYTSYWVKKYFFPSIQIWAWNLLNLWVMRIWRKDIYIYTHLKFLTYCWYSHIHRHIYRFRQLQKLERCSAVQPWRVRGKLM